MMTSSSGRQPGSRACNACREAKKKCASIDGQSKCSHCLKHGKLCVIPTTRKPRIRAAERFAALEKKVETLDAALEARNLACATNPSASGYDVQFPNEMTQDSVHPSINNVITSTHLDTSTAKLLINHWTISVQSYFPFISMIDADMLSNDTEPMPMLSRLIACVSSLAILPAVGAEIIKGANEELVRRVYNCGEQSTDLVLALLLHSQFLAYHNQSNDLRFSPHVYTASSMAVDLGIGKLARTRHPLDSRRAASSARMWLARYCAMSVSTSLLRCQRFVEDDTDLELIMTNLLGNQCKIPSDQSLCELVKLHQIVNESAEMTSRDHQPAWDDPATSAQLVRLQRLLENWMCTTSRNSSSTHTNVTAVSLLYNAVRLYINRLAIISFRLKFTSLFSHQQQSGTTSSERISGLDHISILQSLNTELSEDHLSVLQTCLESSQQVVRLFVSIPLSTIRSLPLSYYHWTLFAIVCLLKLAPLAEDLQQAKSFPAAMSRNENSVVETPDTLLQLCSDRLKDICQNGHAPHLIVFLNVLHRLQMYYAQKRELCMNEQAEGCSHGIDRHGNKALNLLRDKPHAKNDSGSEDVNARLLDIDGNSEQDRARENFEGITEPGRVTNATEGFMEQMDRFFEQEDDGQWLGLLDWDWT